MADFADHKTHAPTPHRRQRARESGRVAQSQELNSAVLLVGALALLLAGGGALCEFLARFLRQSLGGHAWQAWIATDDAAGQTAGGQIGALLPALGRVALPIVAGAALVAVGVGLLQNGFGFWPRRVAPDFARINPLAGMRRVFSGASAARVLLGLVKIGIVGAIAVAGLWSRRVELAALAALNPPDLAVRAWEVCFGTCLAIAAALLALAAIDYLYQRWRMEHELKMTPQELRDEMRQLEGDPQIAARRRELRRSAADPLRVPSASRASVERPGGLN